MSLYDMVKIAAISPPVLVAAPQKNALSAAGVLRAAQAQQVQAAVLPELFLSGSTCGDLFLQETLLRACETALGQLLQATAQTELLCAVGLPVQMNNMLFTCAAVFQSGKLLGVVPKAHIPTRAQARWFSAAKKAPCQEVTLCGQTAMFGRLLFDAGDGSTLAVAFADEGDMPAQEAQIVLRLGAASEGVTTHTKRLSALEYQSAAQLCAIAEANSGVGESTTDCVFAGACTVAENGAVLAQGSRFSRAGTSAVACVDTGRLRALRRQSDREDAQVPSLPRVKVTLPPLREEQIDRQFSRLAFVPQQEEERAARCAEILQIQTAGLVKRMLHTGIKKLALNLSGGLDSTLALVVCARAIRELQLPGDSLLCLTLPGFGTTEKTKNNAHALAASFGAALREISIVSACIQHMQDIGQDMNTHDTTYENLQARERTQILMDIANKENALAVGTGDLSELALGWTTYNGDHMSMYGVNAGVPKTLIAPILRYVAGTADEKTAAALHSVCDTPVSPELLPPDKAGNIAQKTEDILGPYVVHDFYLYHFCRFGFAPEKLLFMAKRAFAGDYAEQQLRDWLRVFLRRFFSQQFKRSCMPDGPKVGSINLSPRGAWQMPSDAQSVAWLEGLED